MRPINQIRRSLYQKLCPFDAPLSRRVALSRIVAFPALFSAAARARAGENALAVINGGISSAEDGPFVSSEYQFLPGDYLFFTFEIAGFAIHSENAGETRKISLHYDVTVRDHEGRALAAPVSDGIQADLSPEDKNWVPKRRGSFLLPSFTAAGDFQVQITATDLFGKTETTRQFPFLIGGTRIQPSPTVKVENFRFLRGENDNEPLEVPAYSPGDTVYARFEIVGFRNGPENQHHVGYGVTVLDPRGKPLIQNPVAANLEEGSFYPAQFIPGNVALKIGKGNPLGGYVVLITVKDLLAGQQFEVKQAFSIE